MNWISSDHIEISCSSQRSFSFDPLSLDFPDTRFSILFLIEWLKIVFYKLPTSNSVGLSEQLSNWGNFNWRVSLLICKVNLFSDSFCIRWMRSRLTCSALACACFMCHLRWLDVIQAKSHWPHLYGFSPVCFRMCLLRCSALVLE